jgi:hypothetical protein
MRLDLTAETLIEYEAARLVVAHVAGAGIRRIEVSRAAAKAWCRPVRVEWMPQLCDDNNCLAIHAAGAAQTCAACLLGHDAQPAVEALVREEAEELRKWMRRAGRVISEREALGRLAAALPAMAEYLEQEDVAFAVTMVIEAIHAADGDRNREVA